MLRFVWFILFLGFLGHATGASAAIQAGAPTGRCTNENSGQQCPCSDEHCPPNCADCVCCVPLAIEVPRVPMAEPTWRVVEAPPELPPSFVPEFLPSPEPRELLHVPR